MTEVQKPLRRCRGCGQPLGYGHNYGCEQVAGPSGQVQTFDCDPPPTNLQSTPSEDARDETEARRHLSVAVEAAEETRRAAAHGLRERDEMLEALFERGDRQKEKALRTGIVLGVVLALAVSRLRR